MWRATYFTKLGSDRHVSYFKSLMTKENEQEFYFPYPKIQTARKAHYIIINIKTQWMVVDRHNSKINRIILVQIQ